MRHVSRGTFQIRTRQTIPTFTWACPNTTEGVSVRGSMYPLRGPRAAGLVLRVKHRTSRSAPQGVERWYDGELRDGLEPVLRGARGTTIETSEVGTVLDQGSSSSQGEEGQHVAGIGAREPCASRNATSSSTSPPKLAWLNTTPTSRRVQAARTALDLGRPPPSP